MGKDRKRLGEGKGNVPKEKARVLKLAKTAMTQDRVEKKKQKGTVIQGVTSQFTERRSLATLKERYTRGGIMQDNFRYQ